MRLSSIFNEGKLVLIFHGELDHHAARGVMEEIDRKIDNYLPRDVELDMSALIFMDSSGIAVILKTYKRVKEIGGRMCIDRISPQPLKVLDASGIERIISIRQS